MVGVAGPRTARGRIRWAPASPEGSISFGWVAHRSEVPVVLPPQREAEFWHVAPDRWRIEAAGEVRAVHDGERVVVWLADGPVSGTRLLAPGGPADLLHPVAPGGPRLPGGREPSTGSVAEAELLGRRCWHWTHEGGELWVDDASGCALRRTTAEGTLELTELEIDCLVENDLFSAPDDVPPAPPLGGVPPEPHEHPRRPDEPPFRVPWWPFGCTAFPIAGDPDVPEVLLVLQEAPSGTDLWLGIAPAGRDARTAGDSFHRWEGDGWTFALSWRGTLDETDLRQLVDSVPRAWT